MKLLEGSLRRLPGGRSSEGILGDMLAVLLVTSVLPVVYHGLRAALLIGGSMLLSFAFYVLAQLLGSRRIWVADCSPLITGAVIALLLPANVPFWVVAVADAFAILVAKEPFGGTGRNPFNPGAAGVAFVTVLWPQYVFFVL